MINEKSISAQIESASANAFKVEYGGDTLITDTIARNYLDLSYGFFTCDKLVNKYSLYVSMTAADLSKALAAYNATYNPLDNYNGETIHTSIESHGDEIKNHTTGGDDGTHNTTTNAALTGTETSNYVTTDDNANPRLESKSTNAGGNEITDDLYTTDTTTHDTTTITDFNGDSVTGDLIHTEKELKHGNLGVTTTQQMIDSEVEMRLNPVTKRYLDNFIYQYAYYSGGAWDGDYV